VHLVGFTIEIYYDARSYKRQIIINVRRPSYKVPVNLITLQWNEFSGKIFEKTSN